MIEVKCRFCPQLTEMPEELSGLESELKFDVCDDCEDEYDDEEE